MSRLKLHFQRYEFKYVLPPGLDDLIRARLLPYMEPDPYSETIPGQRYQVYSLYYDSPAFYYYQQKLDGVERRKKIRLRTYRHAGSRSDHIFFEVKRKIDTVILKDRFLMTTGQYQALQREEEFLADDGDQNRVNLIAEFETERQLRSITPKILVRYEREPYLGKFNQNMRVTFDRRIEAMENDNLFYDGHDWADVFPEGAVMELKFSGTMPFYLGSVIREFNLERSSFSKYCQAVDFCGSLGAVSRPLPFRVQAIQQAFLERSFVSGHNRTSGQPSK